MSAAARRIFADRREPPLWPWRHEPPPHPVPALRPAGRRLLLQEMACLCRGGLSDAEIKCQISHGRPIAVEPVLDRCDTGFSQNFLRPEWPLLVQQLEFELLQEKVRLAGGSSLLFIGGQGHAAAVKIN